MIVKLEYFKRNGKWYTSAEYNTQKEALYEIWSEVINRRDEGKLWGLIEGHSKFIISISVPEHPHNHPHLVL
jgi:hypothetical protein